MESKKWDDDIPNICKVIKNVPNHQPVGNMMMNQNMLFMLGRTTQHAAANPRCQPINSRPDPAKESLEDEFPTTIDSLGGNPPV